MVSLRSGCVGVSGSEFFCLLWRLGGWMSWGVELLLFMMNGMRGFEAVLVVGTFRFFRAFGWTLSLFVLCVFCLEFVWWGVLVY